MELGEKLQQLRKQNNWTQEQLAEQLYISRTAVSKWESGKGYPSIDSLKNISALFKISIDDLLSGDELVQLATNENKENVENITGMIYGLLDLVAIAFIFLPFYGNPEGDYIRAVNLIDYKEVVGLKTIYYILLLSLFGIGAAELGLRFFEKTKSMGKVLRRLSVGMHILAILLFSMTRQPYLSTFLFILFLMKGFITLNNKKL
ncbi:DNA-binding transcriptional regulator, XRE-family HTH domain [Acetoanaerobium noterae]|uniref:DNA-binding transcriptional regulator, XRE-family HTH domain n=1 Tax=Acetoanaerobium noterae TaxID=745369 RepID=A0A1T5CWI0_9FIRM|nr:helix-turn-helix transcriptional regulator [Acetoanaerobium noterae]SKB63792.1 DNA-binding transcriptional regulator, XRE-family HTH domain [Acetoanaerobium noterae]